MNAFELKKEIFGRFEWNRGRLARLEKRGKAIIYADEKLTERRVTYALEFEGKLYMVENAPGRAKEEPGEQFFSPLGANQNPAR